MIVDANPLANLRIAGQDDARSHTSTRSLTPLHWICHIIGGTIRMDFTLFSEKEKAHGRQE
jgi:hypothetical protein